MKTKRAVLIALLPTLHLSACLIMATARVASGWMYVSMVDFPASAFAMALSYNWDHPLVLFGAIGTLWWLMLSVGAVHLFERISKGRSQQAK